MSEILLVSDIIDYLRIDRMTAYKLIREKKIRAINLGTDKRPQYRIKKNEFEEDLQKLSSNY